MPSKREGATIQNVATGQHAASFEGLLDAVPDALFGLDPEGMIRFVNRQAESLFGYDRDDLVGLPIETLVPEILRQVHTVQGEQNPETPHPRTMGGDLDLRGRRRDGTQLPVDISMSHLDSADGPLVIAAVRDMTHYRRTDPERRRPDKLLAIVEHSDDALIGTTLDGTVTSWSPTAEKVFGYSSKEIVGRSESLITPADRAEEGRDILARIAAGQRIDHCESIRTTADGTRIMVSLSGFPLRDAEGAIVGVSTIARDVTESRLAFEAARSMMEASQDSLVALDAQGTITDANEATVKLTGVPRDTLIGTAFSDYFTDPEQADQVHQRVFTQDGAVDYRLMLRHHHGRETLTEVLYNASVQRDTSGKVLGVFAKARDATTQRQAFEAARSMMEASLDSLVAISPEGKITDANEATVKLTGVPRDTLIGTSFSDYFTDPTKAEAVYQRVLAHGEAVDYPLTLRHRDGHPTLTEVRYNASVYRDNDGNVLGVFAAARDVTQEVQAQRRVAEQQRGELERLAELERFQRLTVGRELKMIELKKEIELLKQSRRGKRSEPSHAEQGGFTQAERDESGHAEEGNTGEE